MPILVEPAGELITAAQITTNTIASVSLLLECGGQIIQVIAKWPASESGESRWPRKIGLDHKPLLLL
jgi:hypothetical protein